MRALFDHETARWVRESRSFFTVAEEETADGLLVTLAVRREADVLQWLLGWGSHVRVLEPESLRERIAAEAEALLGASFRFPFTTDIMLSQAGSMVCL